MNSTLFIASCALILFTSCKKKNEEWVSPTIAPITEAVFAPGHVEAVDQFTLTALNDGYINDVMVQEGDRVTSGQPLFIQDNTAAAIQQQTATENLHIAQQQASSTSAVMQQLQAQLNTAVQKLRYDETQLKRMEHLYTTRSVAKTDVDNARLSYENSQNNVAAIWENIEATRLNLEQALINSRGQQETAIANNGYYKIKSPGNYKIYTLLKKKGELVRKGEAIAVLGNEQNMKMVLNVDEASIIKISLGQTVLVEMNTQKGNTYRAQVTKIYPAFDGTLQSYIVEAMPHTLPSYIINGTMLQANIIVAKKQHTMLVPRSCIGTDGKAIVKRQGKTDTITVQTGIISTDWAEVLSGLTTDDKILKL